MTSRTLPAKLADSVDLKDGLLNNRVCTVKFRVVESYFSFNTWRFGDSDSIRWYFTARGQPHYLTYAWRGASMRASGDKKALNRSRAAGGDEVSGTHRTVRLHRREQADVRIAY